MFKREMIRIGAIACIGFLAAVFFIYNENTSSYYVMLGMPMYFIGTFYAAKILLQLSGVVVKTYFTYQFISLGDSFWKTLLCVFLLCLGLAVIFSFGWLIGLGKCIYCLVTAYQLDQQCKINSNKFDF